MGRIGALDSLVENGVTKAELEKIRQTFTGEPIGDNIHIVNALDKTIANQRKKFHEI